MIEGRVERLIQLGSMEPVRMKESFFGEQIVESNSARIASQL
jgi:hypothetical protein